MFQIRPPSQLRRLAWQRSAAQALAVLASAGLVLPLAQAQAQEAGVLAPELLGRVQSLAQNGARAGMPAQARVDVEVGKLDPRLRLAPCLQVQPYLPAGLQMWGQTRIGLRCVDGRARWNVSLPVKVRVFARAVVATDPLPAGAVLAQEQLSVAEIDIAAEPGAVFSDATSLNGRALARPLAAGEAVRSSSLKLRQVFAAGDTVTVLASGPGYSVAGEGQALAAGLEGQNVKVRFDNGRVVTGRAIGERRVEVLL